ncbi:MAG TPA: molybdenum cofactor biosynthesis protein MoaE [Longimicrobiaceae bacterium]
MPAITCSITDQPIDAAAILNSAISPSDGAALLFLGVVRNHNEGREVGHLEYSAFREMAERVLAEIAREAAERWETGDITVVHRIGRLDLGEASVAIAVASPHRDAAYQASRYIIEELKRRAPIWKKEGYLEGESAWLSGHSPAPRELAHE